ncbi:hypothetical protein NBRC116494_26250 [Aurantivibrio plasticivorans]
MNILDDLIKMTLAIREHLEKDEIDLAAQAVANRDHFAKRYLVDEFVESMSASDVEKYQYLLGLDTDNLEFSVLKRDEKENNLSKYNKNKKMEKIYKNI